MALLYDIGNCIPRVCVCAYKHVYALYIFGCIIARVFYIIVIIPYNNDNEPDEVESWFTLHIEMLLSKPKYSLVC